MGWINRNVCEAKLEEQWWRMQMRNTMRSGMIIVWLGVEEIATMCGAKQMLANEGRGQSGIRRYQVPGMQEKAWSKSVKPSTKNPPRFKSK
jgi:hypothetical protein